MKKSLPKICHALFGRRGTPPGAFLCRIRGVARDRSSPRGAEARVFRSWPEDPMRIAFAGGNPVPSSGMASSKPSNLTAPSSSSRSAPRAAATAFAARSAFSASAAAFFSARSARAFSAFSALARSRCAAFAASFASFLRAFSASFAAFARHRGQWYVTSGPSSGAAITRAASASHDACTQNSQASQPTIAGQLAHCHTFSQHGQNWPCLCSFAHSRHRPDPFTPCDFRSAGSSGSAQEVHFGSFSPKTFSASSPSVASPGSR